MRVCICFLLLFIAAPSWAQENLEPDDALVLAGEQPRLFGRDYARHLKPAMDDTVRVFDVTEGGLMPDFVVGLKTVKTGTRIFMLAERGDGGLDRCEAFIDDALARDIILAWNKVVRQMRPHTGRPTGGADIPFEHFGARQNGRLVIGRVWDMPPDSNPFQLGRIAGGLLQICSKGRVQPIPEALAEIRTALSRVH